MRKFTFPLTKIPDEEIKNLQEFDKDLWYLMEEAIKYYSNDHLSKNIKIKEGMANESVVARSFINVRMHNHEYC